MQGMEKSSGIEKSKPQPKPYEAYSEKEKRDFEKLKEVYKLANTPQDEWDPKLLAYLKACEDEIYNDDTDVNDDGGAQPRYNYSAR